MTGCEILLLLNKFHTIGNIEVGFAHLGSEIENYRSKRKLLIATAGMHFIGHSHTENLCSMTREAQNLARVIETSKIDYDLMLKDSISANDNTPWYENNKRGGFKNKRNWRY